MSNRMLANTAALIEALLVSEPLSPAELSERIGIARPSVYRLAEGTTAIGLTEITDDSRIRLGRRWLHLADAAARGMSEWRSAQPILDRVATATGQTAFLSVPRGTEATCVLWAPGSGIDLLALKPGRSLPLHAGAGGRNVLANSPDLIKELPQLAPFERLTDRTLTSVQELRDDIALSQQQGFTVSDEDVTRGIGAIGVPVRSDGQFRGCLSLGGLIEDIRGHTARLVEVLSAAAEELAITTSAA